MKRVNKILMLIVVSLFVPFQQLIYANSLDSSFHQELEAYLDGETSLHGAITSISVRSKDTGEILFERLGDTRLRPASNMKLLTAAAALSALGEDYRFQTDILTDGKIKWKTLFGNLYIKGKGDPTLMYSDIDKIIKDIKSQGVKIIRGELIADDTWYDDIRYSIDLPWSDETAYYGAALSALTVSPTKMYDAGTVLLEFYPGKEIGDKAIIIQTPKTDFIHIENMTTTIQDKELQELFLYRKHGTNCVIVKGQLPISIDKVEEKIAVWEPTEYVLDLFKQALEINGIKLLGNSKIGKVPNHAAKLATYQSITLSELLIPFMKFSNNTHAEILIKEMGKVKKGEGSWEKGMEVLISELEHFGLSTDTFVLRDGSGISHVNLITTNEISNLLFAVQEENWFPTYLNSLPISGHEDKMKRGTLYNRMNTPLLKGKVRAKTGTISTVSSLAGYLETSKSNQLIFSIIVNNFSQETNAKNIEDTIVSIISKNL